MHQMIVTVMTTIEDKNIYNNNKKERFYNAPSCYLLTNGSSFF
jgi:hypothetical protein